MKKLFLFFMAAICIGTLSAQDARFFKDGNLISSAYVNSPEELRIRSDSTLSAKKIGLLTDRQKVKILNLGDEATIDGIKSNWVKILLPYESVKNEFYVGGWVFGGYLTPEPKNFSTAGWTSEDLRNFLSRFTWYENSIIFDFQKDSSYFEGRLESGWGGAGTYTPIVEKGDMKARLKVSYGDETYEESRAFTVGIDIVDEWHIILTAADGNKKFNLSPAFMNSYYCDGMVNFLSNSSSDELHAYNALFYSFSGEMFKEVIRLKKDEDYDFDYYQKLILMGIELNYNQEYMEKFSAAWDR